MSPRETALRTVLSFTWIEAHARFHWERFSQRVRATSRPPVIECDCKASRQSIFDRSVDSAGFTLVEVLVVLAIISLLMGLVGPRVLTYLSESKVKATSLQIKGLSGALDLYHLDIGRYPDSSEGLQALIEKPAAVERWSGPYLKGNTLPTDPWGRAYIYRSPGQHGAFDIVSLGPAGQDGESGNITSWQP